MEIEKSAGCIVFYIENKEPHFLILQNTLKKTYFGFPKGQIESGETIEQAAIRETQEEVNLSNLKLIPGFKYTQQWFYKLNNKLIKKFTTYLLAEIPKSQSNNVKINHENEDFKWLTYEEAQKIIKIKQNKIMLQKAYEFIKEYKKQRTLI